VSRVDMVDSFLLETVVGKHEAIIDEAPDKFQQKRICILSRTMLTFRVSNAYGVRLNFGN
jgi:hypothetical protein